MRHVRSYLTSRVLATGAAVALLGGGAALADGATGTVGGSDVEEGDVEAIEEVDTEGEVETDEDDTDDEADEVGTGEGSGTFGSDADDGERSERAREVHRSLTSDQEVREPGPGFGAAVSANARDRNGPPDHAGGPPPRGDDGRPDKPDKDGREGRPADAGPPPHAGPKAERGPLKSPPSNAADPEREGPPDHAPAHGRRGTNGDDTNGDQASVDE